MILICGNLRSCGRRVGECGACEGGFDDHDVCGGCDCERVHGEGDVDAEKSKRNEVKKSVVFLRD